MIEDSQGYFSLYMSTYHLFTNGALGEWHLGGIDIVVQQVHNYIASIIAGLAFSRMICDIYIIS